MKLKKDALKNIDVNDDILYLLFEQELDPYDLIKDSDEAKKVSDAIDTILDFIDIINSEIEEDLS